MGKQMNKTQRNILDAAFEMLAQDVSLPLEKIADAAGVTRMTLHRYYNGRQALIEAAVMEVMRVSNKIIADAVAQYDHPYEQLQAIVMDASLMGDRFHFLMHAYEEIDSNLLDSKLQELDAQMFKIFDALRAEGYIAENMPNAWLSHLYGGIMTAAWNSLKEGMVARKMIPVLAWQSFERGTISKSP